jgi:tellurite resistance protein TerC
MGTAVGWVAFGLVVVTFMLLDLGVFHKKAHDVKLKESLAWTVVWVSLAMLFCLGVYVWKGGESGLEFLTAYLVEESLSVDNIFVFLMIFTYFGVAGRLQHKVLFWGIIGAQIMRAIFIFGGVALIERFHWIIYVFGAFLVITGARMGIGGEKKIEPEKNPVVRLFRRFLPVTETFQGDRFFVKRDGRWWATPLLVVVIVVETTDVVFAVDSIPAVLSISLDPFIVFTSNIFAILGLRSLYFALAGVMGLFRYLKYGLAVVLVFVGIKMLIVDFYKFPTWVALSVLAAVLGGSVLASIAVPEREEQKRE